MYSRISDDILRESNVKIVRKCQDADKTKSKRGEKRKSLQVLQPSATNQHVLVGRDGVHEGKNIPKMKKPKLKKRTLDMTDYEAVNSPAKIRKGSAGNSTSEIEKCLEETIQKQGSRDASFLMSEDIPTAYWKDLAEERRKALEEALKENESLHIQLEVLEEENTQLREIVDLAKGLAETVEGITE